MKKKLEKLIEHLFCLFVFLLPWQTTLILREPRLNGQIWEYGKINLYGSDLLLILIFFLWLVFAFLNRQPLKGKLNKKKLPLFLLSILFVLWAALSYFWAADKLLAIYWTVRIAEAMALFWLVLNLNLNFNYLALSFIFGGLIQALLASWQFITQQTFSFKWLGLNYYDMAQSGTSVVQTDLRRWLRAYGGLPHPNILGGFLMAAEILTINFYLKFYERLEKIWGNENKKEIKKMVWPILGALMSFAIIFIGLIFSFSRAAWLGFGLALIIFFFYFAIRKNKPCLINLLKLSLVAALIFGSLFIIYQEPFLSRFQGKQKLERQSITERIAYQKQSRNLREKRFLSGVGVGNYTLSVYREINKNYPARFYQPVHNVYLLIWSELGIIGLLLFLSIIFYSLFFILTDQNRHCERSEAISEIATSLSSFAPRNDKWRTSYGLGLNFSTLPYLSILIAFLMMMFFDHWLWSSHFGLLLFWLVLALGLKNRES